MIIECPFCHTRAKLPESKEGAKVRCSECSKVYRAREVTAKGRAKSGSPTGPIIGVVVVAVVAFGALIYLRGDEPAPTPVKAAAKETAPAPPPAPAVDRTGWDSELVQLAVSLHEAAAAGETEALRDRIHGPLLRIDRDEEVPDWDALDEAERSARVEAALARFLDDSETGTVADWVPYDGEVAWEREGRALVRLSATPPGGRTTKRTVEWTFAEVDDQWRVEFWEQWLSDAERRRRERGYEIVTLSDGSVVREREPEPLGHLEDTPQELRDRIDELLATMIDLDLTTEAAAASREIVAIGKPAIPILLTHLYENKLYDEDDSIQANIVVLALREMSDQYFGYQPQALVGSAMGTTEERRMSAIKQWFAWWYREREDFTGPPEVEEE